MSVERSRSRGASGATALVAGCALLLTACASGGALSPASSSPGAPSSPTSTSTSTPSVSASASTSASGSAGVAARAPAAAQTPPPGAAWSPVAGSTALAVAHAGSVSLLWMDAARLRFRYVPGTSVPEGSPATTADRTPSTWTTGMIAAFDAGFKLRDHVGGYWYRGRTVASLRDGLGAFMIDGDGRLSVGVWGQGLALGAGTVVVRENLPPLVAAGRSRATASDGRRTWGYANGNARLANRSALGRLPDGSLVFEYGHSVTALDMARELVALGVVDAVMLDMNRSWPTGFTYQRVGGRLVGRRIDPRIVRDPSTYLQPFKKDFVVVSAR